MTESEAIETLIGIRRVSGYSKRREEALDMAIAALEKQEGEGGLTMAEYIEREAAIKIVNTPNYNKHDMLFALKTIPAASAADAIAELSKPKWISVEERLPERTNPLHARDVFLVRLRSGCIKTLLYEYDNSNRCRPGMSPLFKEGWAETATPVTHWMPLPEPPKEET